jgi:hypothetical protein
MTQKLNVSFSDSAYAVVAELASDLDVPMSDVVREGMSLFSWIAQELGAGHRLLIQRDDQVTELVIPSLEPLRRLRAAAAAAPRQPAPAPAPAAPLPLREGT